MLFLFNTFSVRLSATMKMMMMVLNKSHVLFFDATNICHFFSNILMFFLKKQNFKIKTRFKQLVSFNNHTFERYHKF